MGKTTCTFLAGNVLASGLRLRVLAMDANRDFGTLASLAPDRLRPGTSMTDLLADVDAVHAATQLRGYVSALPSGLDVLAAPDDPVAMAALTPDAIGQLLAWLGQFYDVILLDLGTGIIDPLAQFGLQRADQAVVVTSPDFVTTEKVIGALDHLRAAPTVSRDAGLTLVVNQVTGREAGALTSILDGLRAAGARDQVVLPRDEQLRGMLDSATFNLDALARPTRMAVRALGLAVARKFV